MAPGSPNRNKLQETLTERVKPHCVNVQVAQGATIQQDTKSHFRSDYSLLGTVNMTPWLGAAAQQLPVCNT
jgi:hypothetical protein